MKHFGIVLLVLALMLIPMVGFGSINQFEEGEGLAVDALQFQQEQTAAVVILPGFESLQAVAAPNTLSLGEETAFPVMVSRILSEPAWQHYCEGGLANHRHPLNCPHAGGS